MGRRNRELVEVPESLEPKERVIVSGYEAFKDIDPIEFEEPDSHGQQTH